MENKIDFVIPWVDGSDEAWLSERRKYSPDKETGSTSRYRDWDNLQYWFRGVEKFAPWVNHVYFVTCGHIPKWLNLSNPKLTVIRHEEFIDPESIPT